MPAAQFVRGAGKKMVFELDYKDYQCDQLGIRVLLGGSHYTIRNEHIPCFRG